MAFEISKRDYLFAGERNTRDLGGIPTMDGRMTRYGRLLRGGALDKLTARDIKILQQAYGLQAVYDLRTGQERAERPDKVVPGARYEATPLFTEAAVGIMRETGADPGKVIGKAKRGDIASVLPDMCKLYASMVTTPEVLEQLRVVVMACVTMQPSEGAILYHCTAGKDRTGVVSAILLEMLGVPRSEVMRDYVLTNVVSHHDANKYHFLVGVLLRDRESAAKLRHVFLAEEEYLNAAYRAIDETYGSMETFVREALGVTAQQQAVFRDTMLA